VGAKKIGLQNIVSRDIAAITAEEFVKEISDGDYFFNNLGHCGRICGLEDGREQIVFRKHTHLIPNPPIFLSKGSEFYRLGRENGAMLICVGPAGTSKEINIFTHVQK
jgi:hypothetical protein